ncbi:MAG TPA: hypothetical protein VKY19_13505 [Ktedonosporobacter sp.]|nr:hypothetical protein [Ktedonosporobacter sp.]
MVWLAIGIILYFAYGMHHSRPARKEIAEGGPATMEEWEQPEVRARNRG